MEEQLYLSNLYDCYFNLLTDKQKHYFEDYYFNNLSLGEISENDNVSRNAVHKALKEIETKLKYYEENIKSYEKTVKIKTLIESLDPKIKEEIKKILET